LAGGVIGYAKANDYDSMIKVLRELSDADKKRLVARIQERVGSPSKKALTTFMESQANREVFELAVREFADEVKSGG